MSAAPGDLARHLADQVARWWVPERWAFIGEVPKTGTGKFDKKLLRGRFAAGEMSVQILEKTGPQRGRVRADGVELAYARWGGEGVPVVGIHGITANQLNFAGLAERLAGRRPFLAFDLRGRGDSDKPAGPYGIEQHARDVEAALGQLRVGPVVLVGHSMGAYVAAAVAARAPERVSALVMVDGGYTPRAPAGLDLEALFAPVLSPLVERLRTRFPSHQAAKELWLRKGTFTAEDWSPWLDDYLAHDLQGTGGELRPKALEAAVRQDFFEMARTEDVEARLRRLRAPLLVLRAEHGLARGLPKLVPEVVAEAIRACVPTAEVQTVPGTTHYTIAFAEPGISCVAEAIDALARRV
jgi:pimeloyl-ACP methyl ester carboxylesterase